MSNAIYFAIYFQERSQKSVIFFMDYLLSYYGNKRPDDDERQDHNRQYNRGPEEDAGRTLSHDEGLPHRLFRHISQHQRQHHRRNRIVQFLEQIPKDTEDDDIIDIYHSVADRVGANGAYINSDRHEDGKPDLKDSSEDGREGHHQKESE